MIEEHIKDFWRQEIYYDDKEANIMKTKILFIFIVFKIPTPNKCCTLIMERYWNPVSERYWNSVSERYWNPVSERYWNPVSERCWNPVSEQCWDPMSERCWNPVPNRSYISTFIRHRSSVGNRCRSDTGMSAADIGTTLFQYWNPTWELRIANMNSTLLEISTAIYRNMWL